ncbi:MAG TPA: hypothetical protein VKE71_10075 [Candidatus Angelobacter sp.]|nr:hypothetical protein [Candidatus Angelobacter sp.]
MNNEQSSTNIMWIAGQMLMIPLATFIYSVNMFLEALQGMQRATDQGMKVVAGPNTLSSDLPSVPASPALHVSAGLPEARAAPTVPEVKAMPVLPAEPKSSSVSDINDAKIERNGTNDTTKKALEGKMLDKDLHDDMLKLVRYKILFVKRDYEWAFQEREALVHDNMDGNAFTAWKIAEFIQELKDPDKYPHVDRVTVPSGWNSYPGTGYEEKVGKFTYLTGFPPEDKKYLRVYYEVLERFPREKFRYEEEQIDVLKDIRDRLPEAPGSKKP